MTFSNNNVSAPDSLARLSIAESAVTTTGRFFDLGFLDAWYAEQDAIRAAWRGH